MEEEFNITKHSIAHHIVYFIFIAVPCFGIKYLIPGLLESIVDGGLTFVVSVLLYLWQYDMLQDISEDEITPISLIDRIGVGAVAMSIIVLDVLILLSSLTNGSSLDIFIQNTVDMILFIPLVVLFGSIIPRYLFRKGYLKVSHEKSSPKRKPGEPLGELFGPGKKAEESNMDQ